VDDPQAWHAPLGGTAPEDVGPDHLRVGWLLWIRQQPGRAVAARPYYWLLAGSHLTRPKRIHSSDHLLSRVGPR
jgi:hypothetical protein